MEEMASLWGYQESILELKHKLLCTMFELESARTEAKEEMRKNEENLEQLLQILKIACQERDEARNQLQILLNKVSPSIPADIGPVLPHTQPKSLTPKSTKVNSIVISSSEFSNKGFLIDSRNVGGQKQPFVQECSESISMGVASSGNGMTVIDPDSAVIDNLVKEKALPQKGKLLQAVMEAGPLLQTLLFAGPPLPRWKNPPSSPQSLLERS